MRLAQIYLDNEDRLVNPQFDEAGRIHDWRNYVSEQIRAEWDDLTAIGQAAVFAIANKIADNEEWD